MSTVSISDVYFEAFVQRATELLNIGYVDARPQITAITSEEHVTELIVAAIVARLSSGDVPSYLHHFDASDDAKVAHPGRHGKNRKRIDIRILRAAPPRPTLEVEAKCLRKSTHTIAAYTGAEGLSLFVSEEYARDCSIAAMMGYVQTDTEEYWFEELKRKLGSKENENQLQGELEKLADTPFTHAYRSRHSRASGRAITIHHFLVKCLDT